MPKPTSDILPDLTWFEAGSAILDGILDDPACYPVLDDVAAQREWLSGFTAAWSALSAIPECDIATDWRRGTLSNVLACALSDRPDLLTQLQAHFVEHPASEDIN